jgi:hypothetical protein
VHAAWAARVGDVNASVHLLSYREDAAQELLRSLCCGLEGLPGARRRSMIAVCATHATSSTS